MPGRPVLIAVLCLAIAVGTSDDRAVPILAKGFRGLVLWLCVFALSAVLPSLAASEASSAIVQAASSAPGALCSAQSSATLASSLDPLSDAGLRAEATVALHRGCLARARLFK